jgi:hypothetical protein
LGLICDATLLRAAGRWKDGEESFNSVDMLQAVKPEAVIASFVA